MGNVSASAKPLTSNVPATPSGLPELSKDLETTTETNKSHNDEDRGNPGTMEELHKKCKGKRHKIMFFLVTMLMVYNPFPPYITSMLDENLL